MAFFPIAYRMVGSAARMRESSFTTRVFLSRGTLKSTRMKTRFPARSSCSMDLTMLPFLKSEKHSAADCGCG